MVCCCIKDEQRYWQYTKEIPLPDIIYSNCIHMIQEEENNWIYAVYKFKTNLGVPNQMNT